MRLTPTSDSAIEQAASKLRTYRGWVGAHPPLARVLLSVGALVVLLVVGLAVGTLQAVIGSLVTQILTWAVLLAVLYTWYAAVRPTAEALRSR